VADQTSRSAAHSGRSRPGLALHGHPNSRRGSAITNKSHTGTPAAGPARPHKGSEDPDLDGCIGTTACADHTDAGRRWSTCTGNVRRNGQAGQSDTASPTLPDHPDGDGADWVGYTYPRRLLAPPGALDSQLRRLSANRQAEKPMKCAASQRARRRRFSLCLARAPEAR
jgi:hypothetical protein